MSSLTTSTPSTKLDQVHLSSSERCCIERFITQYIQTRDIEHADCARQRLLEALEDYPCAERVALFELNAWLDNRLGFRAVHLERLDVPAAIDHPLARLGDRPKHPGIPIVPASAQA